LKSGDYPDAVLHSHQAAEKMVKVILMFLKYLPGVPLRSSDASGETGLSKSYISYENFVLEMHHQRKGIYVKMNISF
jgi:hypothetical protein